MRSDLEPTKRRNVVAPRPRLSRFRQNATVQGRERQARKIESRRTSSSARRSSCASAAAFALHPQLRQSDELDGQRPGLQCQRKPLGVAKPASADVDLRAVVTRDTLRVADEVDVRRRLDLAVEDDREMLRAVQDRGAVGPALADERPTLRLAPRDRMEDLLAFAGELDQHDRLVRLRIDVLPKQREVTARLRSGTTIPISCGCSLAIAVASSWFNSPSTPSPIVLTRSGGPSPGALDLHRAGAEPDPRDRDLQVALRAQRPAVTKSRASRRNAETVEDCGFCGD